MITLYSKDNCRYCVAVANFLRNNGVEFKEINIDEDEEGMKHVIDKGYMSIPVTEVEGQEDIHGFDLKELNKLVK